MRLATAFVLVKIVVSANDIEIVLRGNDGFSRWGRGKSSFKIAVALWVEKIFRKRGIASSTLAS